MANKKEYAAKNLAWLEEKSKEEGVKALAKGIYYKVIKSAEKNDKHPTPRNIITAHYSGYTINGKKFDSSRGGAPLAMRLALGHMSVGDRWEIYLPANCGYGRFSQPGIPANSTLIFDIELLGIM